MLLTWKPILPKPNIKKSPYSSLIPLGADCINCIGKSSLYLGAIVLTTPKALYTVLYFPLVLLTFERLVDLGSSNCFLDSSFATKYKLLFWEIASLLIVLIDSAINAYITCVISLPIEFSCGYVCNLEFFVMKLEGTYPAVLGYNWLVHCNPTINWIEGTILCLNSNSSPWTVPFIQIPGSDAISPIESLTFPLRVLSSSLSRNPICYPILNYKDLQAKNLGTNRPVILFVCQCHCLPVYLQS